MRKGTITDSHISIPLNIQPLANVWETRNGIKNSDFNNNFNQKGGTIRLSKQGS